MRPQTLLCTVALYISLNGCGAAWRNQPGSCKAAALGQLGDALGGKGPSQQTAMWSQQCNTDRAIAAANEQYAAQAAQLAEIQELERQRLELEKRRQEQELELRRTQAEGPRLATATIAAPSESRLLLFGGRDHKTFLGCLCDMSDGDSVLNEYGNFGSPYSLGPSIWNHYGDYGSRYSDTSVCNPYANEPPILVTSAGQAVGYLTMNRYKPGAINEDTIVNWLNTVVCENQ